jgi:hypothetical protein
VSGSRDVLCPCRLRLADQPTRPLRPGEIRMRARVSDISHGTELGLYRGTSQIRRANSDPRGRGRRDARVGPGEACHHNRLWLIASIGPGGPQRHTALGNRRRVMDTAPGCSPPIGSRSTACSAAESAVSS